MTTDPSPAVITGNITAAQRPVFPLPDRDGGPVVCPSCGERGSLEMEARTHYVVLRTDSDSITIGHVGNLVSLKLLFCEACEATFDVPDVRVVRL